MALSVIASKHRRWLANKRVLSTIGVGVAAVSLAAVSWLAFRALQSGISLADVRWAPFLASICLQVLTLLALPLLWGKLVTRLEGGQGSHIASFFRLDLYKAYSRSWLARYIPGRIWMLGGRMVFAARYGVAVETVVRSMAFEIIFIYGVLAALGAGLILGARVHFLAGGVALVLGVIGLTLMVAFSQRLPGWGHMIKHRNPLVRRFSGFTHRILIGAIPLNLKGTVWSVAAYGTYSCLQLLFIVLLAEGFADLTIVQALTIAGAWGIGSVLGYFAFIAPGPGGLGIRDGVTLVLFSQVIDLPTAALIVAVSRLVMITADIAFVGIVELVMVGRNIANWCRSNLTQTKAGCEHKLPFSGAN